MLLRRYLTQIIKIIAPLVGMLMVAHGAQSAFAQSTVVKASFLTSGSEPIRVNVLTGQSCLVIFDEPVGQLALSNAETAEAVTVAPDQMMVNGKASGKARFTAWAKESGKFIFFDVDVRANLEQIDSQVRALFPKEDIRLSQANGSVVISGAAEPKVAQQIETIVQAAGFKTVNLVTQAIQTVLQVQLQLRLVEVSRNKLSELAASPVIQSSPGRGGYVNTGQGPYMVGKVEAGELFGMVAPTLNVFAMSNNAFLFLRALQSQGALRALAEPNLIAMNGQEASFLAGGELPIPVAQGSGGGGNTVTIQWKEYGVKVKFTPTIIDEQHIRLSLEPEVSTLDYSNGVSLNGFVVPSLRTRRAKTGIELQDGQSFGIAGLLDNNETKSLSKIPILGDAPLIGNLFKSKSLQKSETELVFLVTAKITKPMNPDAVPQMRGVDGLKDGSPLGVEEPRAGGAAGSAGVTGGTASDVKTSGAKTIEIKTSDIKTSVDIKAPTDGGARIADGAASRETTAINNPTSRKDAPAPPSSPITKKRLEEMGWRIKAPEAATLTAQHLSYQDKAPQKGKGVPK
ncbi:MAG: pilus assembly protein N-terminal domain-containing protein [Acidobacteria bacterium]|nr:pilus assembly protein N-terminal domain-containing protein [Acidobacteriota bacterium]